EGVSHRRATVAAPAAESGHRAATCAPPGAIAARRAEMATEALGTRGGDHRRAGERPPGAALGTAGTSMSPPQLAGRLALSVSISATGSSSSQIAPATVQVGLAGSILVDHSPEHPRGAAVGAAVEAAGDDQRGGIAGAETGRAAGIKRDRVAPVQFRAAAESLQQE